MALLRLFAVAVLTAALCGCAAMKNDRILGDEPWEPNKSGAMSL